MKLIWKKKMKDDKFINLVKKHTNTQEKANHLYAEIIEELNKRNLLEKNDIISCLNITEPNVWEEIILKYIDI